MSVFALSIDTAFGLAFDIEKAPTKSGYRPAALDLGAGKELFGNIRLKGFASLLRIGFAEQIVVIGGNEGRYKGETPTINRAAAIAEMLIHDCDIDRYRVRSIPSNSNTGGNIAAMKEYMRDARADRKYGVVSNHYHLPRAFLDLSAAGLHLPLFAAEAFLFLEQPDKKNDIIAELGEGPLAERCAEEMQGIADKIRGTYKPRTDVAATPFVPNGSVKA